jgi:hypothetical protein
VNTKPVESYLLYGAGLKQFYAQGNPRFIVRADNGCIFRGFTFFASAERSARVKADKH